MAEIFPKWVNKVPVYLVLSLALATLVGAFGVWYYFSPEYTDVGYRPRQPVPFSHKLHAGDLSMDCRYCHSAVEVSAVASVPPTQTCMNCHRMVLTESENLAPVRDSFDTGEPIRWVRVHKVPEYAYFNHSAHIRAGVGCASCHGNVAAMDRVMQVEPLSMSWCLECHRQPEASLRPADQITNTNWTPPADHSNLARQWMVQRRINPPTDCSGCHR